MATLLKNTSGTTPECGLQDKALIDNRTEELNADIAGSSGIRAQIMDLHATVMGSSNSKIQTMKKATSFPIQDVFRMLAANPDAKYLRVYNAFKGGEYTTYMAPIDDGFETYVEGDSSDASILSASCCHCNPCTKDKILNP